MQRVAGFVFLYVRQRGGERNKPEQVMAMSASDSIKQLLKESRRLRNEARRLLKRAAELDEEIERAAKKTRRTTKSDPSTRNRA